MRAPSRSARMTPAGGGLIIVLAAALVVLAVGPGHDQLPAVVVIAAGAAIFAIPRVGSRIARGWNARRRDGSSPAGQAEPADAPSHERVASTGRGRVDER